MSADDTDPVDDLTRDFSQLNTENRELQAENDRLRAENEALRAHLQIEEQPVEDSPKKQGLALARIRDKIKAGYRISQDDYDIIVRITGLSALLGERKGSLSTTDRQASITESLAKVWKDITGNEPVFEDFNKVLACLRRLVKPDEVKSDRQGKELFEQIVEEMDREMHGAAGAAGAEDDDADDADEAE